MTTRNGTAARIVAYVAAHPGCTRAELLAGLGVADVHWAMPTYCAAKKLIHPAGPRGSQRYFPTAEMAQARHQAIINAVSERRQHKKRVAWRRDNLRERAQRHANGGRVRDTRPGHMGFVLPEGATLAPDVRITIAPPIKDRWAA